MPLRKTKFYKATRTGLSAALLVIVIFFVVSLVLLYEPLTGLYNSKFGLWVMTCVFVISILLIMWWRTNKLNLAEEARDRLYRENEERAAQMKDVYERVSDAFMALDKNWRFTYVNKRAGEMSKRDPAVLLGKNIWEEFPEAVGSDTYKAYHKAMADQQYTINIDYNGPLDLWYENNIYPSPDGLSVFLRDITKIKKTEKALEKSDAFSKGVLASLSSCVAVIDERGEIITVNKAWENFATENGVTILERVSRGSNYFDVCNKAAAAGDDIAGQAVKGIQSVLRKEIKVFELQYPCHSPKEQRWFLLRVMLFETDSPMAVVAHNNITEIVLAKQKLEASEKNLRQIMENSSEMIWSIDREHRLITFNNVFSDEYNNFLGVPPSPGNIQYELYPPEAKEVWKVKIEEALAGNNVSFERSYASNNEIKHIDIHLHPIKNGNVIEGVTCFVMDITTRKNAEIALSESENYLRTIYNTEPECIKILGPEGELLDMNPAGLAMIEADTLDMVKGKSVLGIVIPEHRMAFAKLTQSIFKGESGTLEFEITGLKGTHRWLETHAVPLKDNNGKIISLLSVTKDVTIRKKTEEKVLKEKLLSDSLINGMPGVVYVFDTDLKMLRWNSHLETVTGYSADEIGKMSPLVFFDQKDIGYISGRIQKVFTDGKSDAETGMITKDGQKIPYYFTGVSIMYEGKPAVLGVGVDLTERKKTEVEKERLLGILQKSLNEIYIFNADTLQFEYVNDGALKNLGYSMEAMSGMTPLDIKPEYTMPEFRELIIPLINHEKEKIVFETVHQRADSSLYPVEVHLQLVTQAGQSVFLAVILDITIRKKALRGLRESEAKLREITASLPGVVYQTVINTDGKMVFNFLSEGVKKYLDEKIEDIYKDSNILFSKVHPDDVDRLRSAIALSSKNLIPLAISYRTFTKEGKYIWVRSDSIPILQEDGTVLRNGALIDVTETKEAEEKLQKSEERFRSLIEQASDSIAITDKQGNISYVNQCFSKLLGYSQEELLNRNGATLMDPEQLKTNPLRIDLLLQGMNLLKERRLIHKDGSIVDVEENVKMIPDGRFLAIFRDIRERKKAEEELNKAHKQLLFHVENTPLGYIEWDNQLFVKSWSKKAEEIFGWNENEFIDKQKHGFSLVYEEDIPKLKIIAQQLMQGTVGQNHVIHRNYTKEGRVIWCEWFNSVLKEKDGNVITIMSQVQDVTERILAEEKIKESEAKYRSLMQQAGDSIVIFDGTGQLLEVNESALQLLGYSGKEYKKMPLKDFVFEEDLKVNPFRFDLLNKGEPTITRRKLKRKDGSGVETELHVKKLSDGRYLGVARDLTERIKAEQKLIDSEMKYRTMVERNLAGIYQTTTEGKILSCNNAFVKILGYGSKNELLQKNAGTLYFSGTDRDDFITRLRTKGEVNNQELQLKNKNGNPVFIIESCSLQKDLITGMEVIDGVLIDITEHKKAERKIAEKDQQLREISSSIPGFIYQFAMEPTGEFHFLYVSESAKTLIGVSPAEAYEDVGNAFAKVHPDDLKGLYESIFASANTLAPWSYTFRVIAEPDTPGKWIRGNSIPKKLENGSILWNGAMFDLTELKLAEEQLSEKEKRFRSLIDTAPDATVIVDEKGIIQIANQQAVKIFGYTKDELMGMPIEMLLPKANKHRHESFRRQFINEPHAREMGLGRDLFALRKDGQVIPVEISLSPFHSDKGVLVTASIRDITERKKADNELKRSEEKYRQLFHNSPLSMWVTEIESKRLIDINEAAIRHYGYSREEFLQMDVWKLQAGKDIEEFNRWLSKNYDDPAVQTGIWQHVRKDKSIIDVEVSSHRIIYEDRPCRLIVANDITERKKAELELEESYKSIRSLTEHLQNIREEERTHIAREIHDELGQQITVMMMDVAWLDRKIDAENTGAKQKIKELLELLDNTVKSVRRISTELRPSVLDDLGLVAAADLHLKEFEKRSGIRTRFIEPETELQLNDQVKNALFRILQESLTNVARHSGAKAATVTLGKKNKKIVLIIEDNGVGFDERKAAAKKTLGVLGMKERAAGIGGEYIISGKPGKGTAITVSVPLQE